MEREEGMTPSFLFADDAERLLFALAPQGVASCLRKHGAKAGEVFRRTGTPAELRALGLSSPSVEAWLHHKRSFDPHALLTRCRNEGIRILFPSQDGWPVRLANLSKHAPRLLFVRGTIPTVPLIAIIGTREPTPYGEKVVDAIVRDLVPSGSGVLSGLALGTDARAHERALAHGLPTIAVLGTNICDRDITPYTNFGLAKRILDAGGGLVSEVPPGTDVHPGTFPARNRLIAALCEAVIVVEARKQSGTIITARVALDIGRDVLAVPGSIFSEASVGTHSLITSGARPYTGINDLWDALKVDAPTSMEAKRTTIQISLEDRKLLDRLRQEENGLSPAALTEALDLDSSSTISRLGMLELQGLVKQSFSGNWVTCGWA